MRLWHESLIPYLPRQQLLGQHRECGAVRGKGWGKKHATMNYVFEHPIEWLVAYHYKVMNEMCKRGYNVDSSWYKTNYRSLFHLTIIKLQFIQNMMKNILKNVYKTLKTRV